MEAETGLMLPQAVELPKIAGKAPEAGAGHPANFRESAQSDRQLDVRLWPPALRSFSVVFILSFRCCKAPGRGTLLYQPQEAHALPFHPLVLALNATSSRESLDSQS